MIRVTSPLSVYYPRDIVSGSVLANAADRGTRVHAACAAIAQQLWTLGIEDDARGYVESFHEWFVSSVVEAVAVEKEFKDCNLGLVGHPDLICRIRGDNVLTLVDYKTAVTSLPIWQGQLAAYCHLARINGFEIGRCASLQLKKDGSDLPGSIGSLPDLSWRRLMIEFKLSLYNHRR
jgi:hypothetical protein